MAKTPEHYSNLRAVARHYGVTVPELIIILDEAAAAVRAKRQRDDDAAGDFPISD